MRSPSRRAVVLAVLGIGVVAAGALYVTFGLDGRAGIGLERFVPPGDMTIEGARIVTAQVCGAADPCVEALEAPGLKLRKYESKAQASERAEALGQDGHLSGWIVVEYDPGVMLQAERQEFETFLDGINTGSPD